jgi:hypothetical protein
MKANWGVDNIAPRSLDLGTRRESLVSRRKLSIYMLNSVGFKSTASQGRLDSQTCITSNDDVLFSCNYAVMQTDV